MTKTFRAELIDELRPPPRTRHGAQCSTVRLWVVVGLSSVGCTFQDRAIFRGDAGEPPIDLPPPPPPPPSSRTFDYVIDGITIDQGVNSSGEPNGMAPNPATHTQGVAGFDLDGLRSTPADAMMRGSAACLHADFFSTLDPDQNDGTCSVGVARGGVSCLGGVDNQLPEIAATVTGFGTDVRMTFADEVRQGKLAILIRVSDVDGTPGPTFNDSSVTIRVYPTGHPMFANCAHIGTVGQNFAVDDVSLNIAGDLNSAKIQFSGSIVNGRLRVATPSAGSGANFTLNLPVMGMYLPLSLFKTQLRVDLTADRGANGNLGGYVQLAPFAAMLTALLPAGIPVSTIQTVLQSLVDVRDPAGDSMGCTAPNGGIALGYGFTAVRAVVSPSTVQGAQVGMCGTP